MASLVDAFGVMDTLGFFTVVFPFLLVMTIVYGILSKIKPFGESPTVNIVIAVITGIIFTSLTSAVKFLNTLLPLFTGALIVIMLLLMVFLFIGIKPESIAGAIKTPAGYTIIIGVIIIFIFISLSAVDPYAYYYSHPEDIPEGTVIPGLNAPGTPEDLARQDMMRTLFSPAILGLIVLMLVFAGASYLITREAR